LFESIVVFEARFPIGKVGHNFVKAIRSDYVTEISDSFFHFSLADSAGVAVKPAVAHETDRIYRSHLHTFYVILFFGARDVNDAIWEFVSDLVSPFLFELWLTALASLD
jgi:hypothetical protein